MKRIPSTALLFFASIAQLHAQTKLPDELRTSFGQFGPTETSFIYTYEFNLEPLKGRVTLSNANDTHKGTEHNDPLTTNSHSHTASRRANPRRESAGERSSSP